MKSTIINVIGIMALFASCRTTSTSSVEGAVTSSDAAVQLECSTKNSRLFSKNYSPVTVKVTVSERSISVQGNFLGSKQAITGGYIKDTTSTKGVVNRMYDGIKLANIDPAFKDYRSEGFIFVSPLLLQGKKNKEITFSVLQSAETAGNQRIEDTYTCN